MGAQGTTTVNFGAFPGTPEANTQVTGQSAILANSLAEAWIFPVATADHSVGEHYNDPIRVVAGEVVAGTGFTIRAYKPTNTPGDVTLWGQYTVAWAWN